MKNKYFIILLFTLVFGVSQFMLSQELPLVSNFSSDVYNAEKQNWDITQSEDKKIYIANNKGLLTYDGERWGLHIVPNESIIRSAKAYGNRVYTGSYMEFGYWQTNIKGNLHYTSLVDKLKISLIEDEEFWNILQLDKWVLFQSLNRIYIYDTQAEIFKIIDASESIRNMVLLDGTIYFQKQNSGLFKLENGVEKLYLDHEILHDDVVVNMFKKEETIWLVLQNKGIYQFKDQNILNLNTFNKEFERSSFYSAIALKNGGFALGTISNGVFILDELGKITHHLSRNNVINNNTVLALFEDKNQNIWLGLDNGLSSVHNSISTQAYKDVYGKLGSVYAAAIYGDNLYLGTNQGLFFRSNNSQDEFEFIEGTQGQVWTLNVHNNNLFCGHNTGTFIVNENHVQKISDVQGTWVFKTIVDHPEWLLQGNYSGLYILEYKNQQWQLRNKVKGFNISSRFVELYNNKVFVNHEYKGLYTLEIDSLFHEMKSVKIDSLKKGHNSGLITYNEQLLYADKDGVFKYNSTSNTFVKDSIYSLSYDASQYISGKLVVSDNKLWTFSTDYINFFTPGKLSTDAQKASVKLPQSLRHSVTGYESVLNLSNNRFLIGSTDGYTIVNVEDNETVTDNDVRLQKVTYGRLENDEMQAVDLNSAPEIPFNHNNIQFLYSAFDFSKEKTVEYQYKLDGFHEHWSSWSKMPQKYFENLPYGNYQFQVRSKIGNTVSKLPATFSFTIKRPWYASNMAIASYIILFALLSYITNNLYKRHYQKQQQAILLQNQKEIELKEYEKEQELMKFRNEKLKEEIETKNRELAVSTMSLIKRNEFLSKIKKELTSVKEIKSIKAVVKTIDNNLNNEDDWEFFKEAFNNADKDFFKRLKEKHPALTPNDLKLCAYLRLNLSSKEIAALLNISTRSTEVKRYRLRKKMNLPHEASLNSYILEI